MVIELRLLARLDGARIHPPRAAESYELPDRVGHAHRLHRGSIVRARDDPNHVAPAPEPLAVRTASREAERVMAREELAATGQYAEELLASPELDGEQVDGPHLRLGGGRDSPRNEPEHVRRRVGDPAPVRAQRDLREQAN